MSGLLRRSVVVLCHKVSGDIHDPLVTSFHPHDLPLRPLSEGRVRLSVSVLKPFTPPFPTRRVWTRGKIGDQ